MRNLAQIREKPCRAARRLCKLIKKLIISRHAASGKAPPRPVGEGKVIMKELKKWVAVACAATVAFSAAACKKAEKKGAEAPMGDFTLGKDELEFSWYRNEDAASSKPWKDMGLIANWIHDNLKVTVNFMDPGGSAAEKLAVMIVSDEFPDVMEMRRGQDANNLIETGKIVPLDEYGKKYTSIYNDYKDNGVIKLLTSKDGKWYQIPNWANSSGNPNGNDGWFLNKKIYEEMGSPKLETFDELYSYLKAVKNKYPDIIPYDSGNQFTAEEMVFAGMLEDNSTEYITNMSYPKGDKLELIFKNPAYREAMVYINRLFNDKLISQDAFTQTHDQAMEKWSNGTAAVMTGNISDNAAKGRINLVPQGNDWLIINPVHKSGLDGSKITCETYNTLGWDIHMITKDAKNPQGIYAFLDYIYSPEGQSLMSYGPKGMYYDDFDENGFPNLKLSYFEKPAAEIGQELKTFPLPLGNTSFVDSCAMNVYEKTEPDKRDWTKTGQKNVTWKTSKNVTEFVNFIPSKSTDEGIIYQSLSDIYKEYRAKMVFAKDEAEVNKLLDSLISECEAAGADQLLRYQQGVWEFNKKCLAK